MGVNAHLHTHRNTTHYVRAGLKRPGLRRARRQSRLHAPSSSTGGWMHGRTRCGNRASTRSRADCGQLPQEMLSPPREKENSIAHFSVDSRTPRFHKLGPKPLISPRSSFCTEKFGNDIDFVIVVMLCKFGSSLVRNLPVLHHNPNLLTPPMEKCSK